MTSSDPLMAFPDSLMDAANPLMSTTDPLMTSPDLLMASTDPHMTSPDPLRPFLILLWLPLTSYIWPLLIHL